jgi:hypothetical protein
MVAAPSGLDHFQDWLGRTSTKTDIAEIRTSRYKRTVDQGMSDEGRELLALLLVRDLASSSHFVQSAPILRLPSQNPRVPASLDIELFGTLQVFWHGGYFVDFLESGEAQVQAAEKFLVQFCNEEILCGVCFRGKNVSGGPVIRDEWKLWPRDYDRLELRSWRGNRDWDVSK